MTQQLQTIPNVGPATAEDLRRLGIRAPDDLEGADPEEMYERLCRLDGEAHDPCVQDVFSAAVHFVETGEERHWSEFSKQRKASGA